MKRIIAVITLAVLATFGATSPVAGSDGMAFSSEEIRIITDWYRDREPAQRGGNGKRKGLPPGIARNLDRGKPLPPGIAKQYLPDDLRRALPEPPRGYERIVVDGKVLLVEVATQVVHDILVDVILR